MNARKYEIFSAAVKLIAALGYEAVTIRDIATAADATNIEVYEYFFSKESILEETNREYSKIILALMPTPEEYIPVLKTGTAEEILSLFNFPLPNPQDINFCIIRIILSRRISDSRAQKAYLRQWDEGNRFMQEVLTTGIELGRIRMTDKEIKNFSHIVHSSREYSANMATMIPNQAAWRQIETSLNKYLSQLLILNDPITSSEDHVNSYCSPKTIDFNETITNEAVLVSQYHYYSAILRKNGSTRLSRIVDEIIENLLDEMDSLYGRMNLIEGCEDSSFLISLIQTKENERRLASEIKAKLYDSQDVDDIFVQMISLAEQHEKICAWSLKSK